MKYIWNPQIAERLNNILLEAKQTKSYFSLTHNRPTNIKKLSWTKKRKNSNEMIIENDSSILKPKYLKIILKYPKDKDPMFAIFGMMIDFEYSLSQDIRENRDIYKRAVIFADKHEIYSLKLPEDYMIANKKIRTIRKFTDSLISYFKEAKEVEIFLFDEDDLKSS